MIEAKNYQIFLKINARIFLEAYLILNYKIVIKEIKYNRKTYDFTVCGAQTFFKKQKLIKVDNLQNKIIKYNIYN